MSYSNWLITRLWGIIQLWLIPHLIEWMKNWRQEAWSKTAHNKKLPSIVCIPFFSKINPYFFFSSILDHNHSESLKRKRGGLIIQSRDYAVVQRRCCLCYSSCRESTSIALNTLLSALRFQVWQTLFKPKRYNPNTYETTIKRRIEWYNQINEIPIIKRKFFLSKIFCLKKYISDFFKAELASP